MSAILLGWIHKLQHGLQTLKLVLDSRIDVLRLALLSFALYALASYVTRERAIRIGYSLLQNRR